MWTKIKLRLTCVYDTPNPQRSLKWTQHIYRSFCGAKLLRLLRASTSRVQMEWTTWNYATSCPFSCFLFEHMVYENHGSLNVPIEHHPTIRYMVYNGYYKVMSNIPKMGQLPTPENDSCGLNLAIWCNFKGYICSKNPKQLLILSTRNKHVFGDIFTSPHHLHGWLS